MTCSFQRAGKECQISLKHNKATGVDYVFFLYQSSAAFFNFIGDIVQKSPLHAIIFLRRINAGKSRARVQDGPILPSRAGRGICFIMPTSAACEVIIAIIARE